jgi:SAM-dependent methyltransferase
VSFPDHFSAVAARYAQYRPHYPRALVELLARESPARDAVWDAGCGNGQLSVALAAHFTHVIATDASQQQLAQAEAHPRVEYRCATAEASGLPDASVDLAVAAQAAHWFVWPRFVEEVARIARPGALVALVAYGNGTLEGDVGELLAGYYAELERFWPPERRHIMNGYAELVWPWPAVAVPEVKMTAEWTREEATGYFATWSATQKLAKAEGLGRYEALCAALARIWPDGERRTMRWPLVVQLARR